MSSQTPVIELRDPLWGPIPVNRGELAVIDMPIFQRLRGIKQLGFAELTFPGAVHHRYLHSIGAMHIGGKLVSHVLGKTALSETERRRLTQLVRLAALLHDIGHPPLSHAAESLLPDREALTIMGRALGEGRATHEDMTLKLVADSDLTEVIDARFADVGIRAAHVAAIIGDHPGEQRDAFVILGLDWWPLLHAMVSGEMDVDRMDYLRRDSYFAGVEYGSYDQSWLISNALMVQDGRSARLGIGLRALPSFEHFLLARYHMFQMVYFHQRSDVYDQMLRNWLASVGDEARFPADPEAYARCNDAWLWARLAAFDDPWARRIREQRPYMLLTELRTEADRERREEIAAALAGADLHTLWITAKPVLSRYAQSPQVLRTNPMLVVDRKPPFGHERRYRIEEVTDLFARYERTAVVERVYVAPEDRRRAREVLRSLA
ncbi:MAG: phosphohydrolase [Proteobacteria bacterium]|nr:MAG: phosphohydrolase [Pseudomonadota bacterium]